MADPQDYDYGITPAYTETPAEEIARQDAEYVKAGIGLIGHKVKPLQTSNRGTLYDDGTTKWWVRASPNGRFFRQRINAGVPGSQAEDVSPNDQGTVLREYEKELTSQPYNPWNLDNPEHKFWYYDSKGKPIPATQMSPTQLINAHNINESFNQQQKLHDVTGIQSVLNQNVNAIHTLDRIKALMQNKALGEDPIGTLQYYANGALNWAKLRDQEKANYPDAAKLRLADQFVAQVRQARQQIAGMDAASEQDKGANLSGVLSSILGSIDNFVPFVPTKAGIIGAGAAAAAKGAGAAVEQGPLNIDVKRLAGVIDGMENSLKQTGVQDVMAYTKSGQYPISTQIRKVYDAFGHELYDKGIRYGADPYEKSVDLNAPKSEQQGDQQTSQTGTSGGETQTSAAGPGGLAVAGRQGSSGTPIEQTPIVQGAEQLWHNITSRGPTSAGGGPAAGVTAAPITTPSKSPAAVQTDQTPKAPLSSTSPKTPAKSSGDTSGDNAPAPTYWRDVPNLQAPTPAPIKRGKSTAEAEPVASDVAVGAPLGANDAPGVARLHHQEHVDALEPGTPFYWRDHADPYVRV